MKFYDLEPTQMHSAVEHFNVLVVNNEYYIIKY